jgi:hypothetical protein
MLKLCSTAAHVNIVTSYELVSIIDGYVDSSLIAVGEMTVGSEANEC